MRYQNFCKFSHDVLRFKIRVENEIIITPRDDLHKLTIVIFGITQKAFWITARPGDGSLKKENSWIYLATWKGNGIYFQDPFVFHSFHKTRLGSKIKMKLKVFYNPLSKYLISKQVSGTYWLCFRLFFQFFNRKNGLLG